MVFSEYGGGEDLKVVDMQLYDLQKKLQPIQIEQHVQTYQCETREEYIVMKILYDVIQKNNRLVSERVEALKNIEKAWWEWTVAWVRLFKTKEVTEDFLRKGWDKYDPYEIRFNSWLPKMQRLMNKLFIDLMHLQGDTIKFNSLFNNENTKKKLLAEKLSPYIQVKAIRNFERNTLADPSSNGKNKELLNNSWSYLQYNIPTPLEPEKPIQLKKTLPVIVEKPKLPAQQLTVQEIATMMPEVVTLVDASDKIIKIYDKTDNKVIDENAVIACRGYCLDTKNTNRSRKWFRVNKCKEERNIIVLK